MIHQVGLAFVSFAVGAGLGVAFHAAIAKEAAATKEELAAFAGRLRLAITSDAAAMKTKMMEVVADIESKIK